MFTTTLSPGLFAAAAYLCAISPAYPQVPTTTTITTITAANVGQTITVAGTPYTVNTKKVITTGVEHYSVKATTPKAITQYFLRTNDRYNATAFTQAQYEAFITTGKLASFGPVLMSVKGQDTLLHVNTGNTVALPMVGASGEVVIYEFINGAQTMGLRTGQVPKRRPRVRGNQYTSCLDKCRSTDSSCNKNATTNAEKEKCTDAYGLCLAGCNVMYRTQLTSVHVVRPDVPAFLY
jgi:hypothetical protein